MCVLDFVPNLFRFLAYENEKVLNNIHHMESFIVFFNNVCNVIIYTCLLIICICANLGKTIEILRVR